MKVTLEVNEGIYTDVIDHLLPPDSTREQAAFLFADASQADSQVRFKVVEARKLAATDFIRQEADYLEMTDAARAGIIKRAHDLGASLIEIHSHLGPWPAGFSFSDRIGLQETVPHMWWRLKQRPYLALVVAESSFDALVWLDNPKVPKALDALVVGDTIFRPTNLSCKGWG